MQEWLKPRLRLGTAVVALTLALSPQTANANIEGAAERASHIYFATDEPLLPALDTDAAVDIYDRFDGELFLATGGDPSCQPGCGNGEFDVDAGDGVQALSDGGLLFSTAESLAPTDADGGGMDIYLRTAEGPQLRSTAPGAPETADDAVLKSHSEDGTAIVFATAEPLLEADTDESVDLYGRAGAVVTLISEGSKGFNGPFDAIWATSAKDQSAVLFRTAEQLEENDTDSSIDLYRHAFGETSRVSRGAGGPETGNGEFDVGPKVFVSEEGRVAFETSEKLYPEHDEDTLQDVYMNFGGTITNISEGSLNAHSFGDFPAELDALDPRANQVIYSTKETLQTFEDHDETGLDVYEWFYDKTILVSQGVLPEEPEWPPPIPATFLDYMPGGLGRILFETAQPLLPSDTDSSPDIYERINRSQDPAHIFKRAEGITKLISQGLDGFNGPFSHTFRYASPDGEQVFFTTRERQVGTDTDNSLDLYVRRNAASTELLSPGLINGNGPFDVTPQGGVEHPLFSTSEQLVKGDTDAEPDLYQHLQGSTRLVSTAKPGPPAPTITGSTPTSPGNSRTPAIRGEAEADSIIEIFTDATCTGDVLGAGSTVQFATSGIIVPVHANAATTLYARTNDIENNPGPCSEGFTYVEDSSPPALFGVGLRPLGPANDNLPVFHGSTESDSVVRVFVDGGCEGEAVATAGGAQLASAGVAARVADDSTTRLSLASTDVAGNTSICVGPFTYVEDSTPPRTRIVTGPRKKRSRARNPLFQLRSNEEEATFTCQLDGRAPAPCSEFATIRKVSRGRHVLAVVATDGAGNSDATPAKWRWKMIPAHADRNERRNSRHVSHKRPH